MRFRCVAPHDDDKIAFRMSVQEFVIAPRPKVGPKLDTVGPCQTRAWLSNTSIPALRTALYVTNAEFIGRCRGSKETGGCPAVHRHSIGILHDEILVAIVFH